MITPVDRTGFASNQDRVLEVMRDGGWHTLDSVARKCGIMQWASVASRIRDFASNQDGSGDKPWRYEKRLIEGSKRLYEYRIYEAVQSQQMELLGVVNAA